MVDSANVQPGVPELQWAGKHPLRSAPYCPARLRERYGEEAGVNRLYWGDNLEVMGDLLEEFRGRVDLVYIDPPFNSHSDYGKRVSLHGSTQPGTVLHEKQYGDVWTDDEYLQFMYERLVLLRELLADSGSLYLHCDHHKSHHLRCLMDEVFGPENFQNDIQWCYNVGGKSTSRWARKHDTILFYSKTADFYFDGKSAGIARETGIKSRGGIIRTDSDGRPYQDKLAKSSGKYYRYYLDEPKIPEDWWMDINSIQSGSAEREDYPTQKPEALLERIIRASCPEGGLVLDSFMGSGTTPAVAMKLGRRFIAADNNVCAVHTTTKRLLRLMETPAVSQQSIPGIAILDDHPASPGFEVWTVGTEDISRDLAVADIAVEQGILVVHSFSPQNLLQKLSLGEELVQDWRQLVDSIMIDWTFDGTVFHPTEIDIPSKKRLVRGLYAIPDNAGTIRLKITDLLFESFKVDVTSCVVGRARREY